MNNIIIQQGDRYAPTSNEARFAPLARRLRDSISLKLAIRMCAAFNAGGLIALVGYAGLLVGVDHLGVSMGLFVPMVAAFLLGLVFAGLATCAWFGSLREMAQAGALAMEDEDTGDVIETAPYRRGFSLQSWTTSLIAASYVIFLAGLAGLPMILSGSGA